jgi:hypothetical protein
MNRIKNKPKLLWLLVVILAFGIGIIQGKDQRDKNASDQPLLTKSTLVGYDGVISWININGFASLVRFDGLSAHNPLTGASGTLYPRGQVGVIYQDGLIWGGLVDTLALGSPRIRVGGATYDVGTKAGWVDGSTPANPDDEAVRIYRIRNDVSPDNNTATDAQLRQDAAEVFNLTSATVTDEDIAIIREQYIRDWQEWPVDKGAPFYNNDGVAGYDPANGDLPGFANGDQVLWYATNDFDNAQARSLYASPGFGLEIQTTMWGYNISTAEPLGNVYFKRYRLINKSGSQIDSMFLSQWSDPDLGAYANDFTGVDRDLSLMFAYNGVAEDADFAEFGYAPAAVGYDFLQGPIVPSAGDVAIFDLQNRADFKNLEATSYSYFTAGGNFSDPELGTYGGTLAWWNMLRGFAPTEDIVDPDPYTTPDGTPTKFPLDGDPVSFTGFIDGILDAPGDRRMLITSGPFTMAPADTQELVVGVIAGLSINNRASVGLLKFYDQAVQGAYNTLFDVPKPPAAPSANLVPLGDQILIDWGADADAVARTEDVVIGSFAFEGYNIYQFDETGSNPIKIATFDVVNQVTTILGATFDQENGIIVETITQNGKDAGIQRHFVVERDYTTGGPLIPGKKYTFAVTAYNYSSDPSQLSPALETALTQLSVVAQNPKPGDQYDNHAPGDTLTVTRTDGGSDGGVVAIVINPTETITADYSVEFTTPTAYDVIDVTNSDTLLKSYENGLGLSPAVNGVSLLGFGPTPGANDWDSDGDRWVSGVNWGGTLFFGGMDIGVNFAGSLISAADVVPVQLVFQDQADVDANGYISQGAYYRRDLGYALQGQGDIPFAAYDVSDPDNPRRLNICFVEMDYGDGTTTANGIWDMGWDGEGAGTGWGTTGGNIQAQGAREYIFIMDSDYDGGVSYTEQNFKPFNVDGDVHWAIWPKERGDRAYLLAPFTLDAWPFYANKAGEDKFAFSTTAGVTGDANLAKAAFDKATVYPNPYYAYNERETGSFARYVELTNLPEKVEVKIFNLGGALVRSLEKDNAEQFLRWDLNNEAGLPVASGLYIIHLDAPDLGKTKVLKSFIVQPEQKVKFF